MSLSRHDPDAVNALAEAVARGADALRIPNGVPIVLAISGGPDSTALLHGAAHLAPSRGWRLTVAHLDHALRTESAEDAAAVGRSAGGLRLPFATHRVDVAALARAEHRSMEDAGRQARYRFLEEVAAELGSDALIATAHTADDAAETILLRLARGSGLRGLRGIPARRGRVVRPLLGERRSALRGALDAAGIAFSTDPTNDDPAHASRNRVRAEVLPALERLNPSAVEALIRFGRLAADDDDLLDGLAIAELARRRDADDGTLDWHNPPSRALGRRVLRTAIGEPTPAAERIEALLDAAEGPRGGLTIELGGGRGASVVGRRIRLS
ncbi:MAG: tRNA lysidine(34) synthetase TilS [Chloroflexota bacterium]|nr:tRNA lysidine(34) synthetase TilS [Chloroflexota bacterium]